MYRNRRNNTPYKKIAPYMVVKDGRVHIAWGEEAKKSLQTEMTERFQKRMNKVVDKIMKKEEKP